MTTKTENQNYEGEENDYTEVMAMIEEEAETLRENAAATGYKAAVTLLIPPIDNAEAAVVVFEAIRGLVEAAEGDQISEETIGAALVAAAVDYTTTCDLHAASDSMADFRVEEEVAA